MRYWEFLIQQEGDQTWLPLETRQVEILEGRYRMAAHTSYDDTSVEVRVSQLLLDEMPPRRRVRKRKAITNDSGLLAIFPFIQLSPGRWEIDCNSPDVIDDFLGEGWHYSVQLQVTPRDEDDWAPDWSDAATDSESPPPEQMPKSDQFISDRTTDASAQPPLVELKLKQQAYVAQLGQTLTLAGHLSQTAEGPLDGRLWVQLRDPQIASTLQEMAFDLPKQPLPCPFSITITLPDELSTQVVLGAISLVNSEQVALASASFTVTIGLAQMLDAIANQPNLDFEEEISIFPGTTEAFVPPPEKAETLLARDTPVIAKEIIPSEGLTLPPQLKPLGATDPEREPELPTFPAEADKSSDKSSLDTADDTSADDTSADDTSADDDTTEALAEAPDLETPAPAEEIPVTVNEPVNEPAVIPDDSIRPELATAPAPSEAAPEAPGEEEPYPFAEPRVFDQDSLEDEDLEDNDLEDDDLDRELATAALDPDLQPEVRPFSKGHPDINALEPNVSSAHSQRDQLPGQSTDDPWDPATANIDQAFQKLQLRERFWQKLNLLTQNGYRQSLEVKKALEISDTLPEGNQQSNEFVAYEPTPQSPGLERQTRQQPGHEPKRDDEGVTRIQVMPPTLDVPEQELVAGDWIAIKVRVPVRNYQPYVKVWMNDLQTRTLIDAPRLLMQFTPNDYNELETLMRIKVPTGCLELQFAAIAIDMASLQESRKVVQNRRVMPPDESLSIFDNWDL